MKEFVYLLNKEGVLLIVESSEEMPIQGENEYNMPFCKKLKKWFTASNKYPCADKSEEVKFLNLTVGSLGLNDLKLGVLTAGIRINKENVKIEEIRFWNVNGRKESFVNCAVFVPSPPLVIGGEETQEEIKELLVDYLFHEYTIDEAKKMIDEAKISVNGNKVDIIYSNGVTESLEIISVKKLITRINQ